MTGAPEFTFASNALSMHGAGLCVLPITPAKTPAVTGFNRWRRRPAARVVRTWIAQFPNHNIAIVPGMAKTRLLVIDCDDLAEDERVEALFGPSPLQVRTRRGYHRYYRDCGSDLPSNLRMIGLAVDIKRGRSLVVAPPSVHESGHMYELAQGNWNLIGDLPFANFSNVIDMLQKNEARLRATMRDGSRAQNLNDRLCSAVWGCRSLEELVAVAEALNREFECEGLRALDAVEVGHRARTVWRDRERGKILAPGARDDPLVHYGALSAIDTGRASDAHVLLEKLVLEHAARTEAGKTFNITPVAMARAGVIPGWTKERYKNARDVLIEASLIERVSECGWRDGKRVGAQYRLTARAVRKTASGPRGGQS